MPGGNIPVIVGLLLVEALPTPPEGRDIIASISLGERKGIWLVMLLFCVVINQSRIIMPIDAAQRRQATRRSDALVPVLVVN